MATTITRYVNTASSGGDGTTNNTSGGTAAYASLNAAILGQARNLVTADEIALFLCSGSTADTTAIATASWVGYVCDATRYIEIRPNTGQEHGGSYNTGVYRIEVTNSNVFQSPTAAAVFHIRVRGIQAKITASNTGQRRGYNAQAGVSAGSILDLANCIMWIDKTGGTTTDHYCYITNSNNWSPVRFVNCRALLTGTTVGYGFTRNTSLTNMYLHNCSVVGATIAYYDLINNAGGTVQVKNSFAYGGTTFSSGAGIENSDYNSTDLATATGGANDRISQTFTFVNAGAGDYQPTAADAAIRAHGVDLSADANAPVTTDINGDAVNSPPDIGPENAVAAGGGGGDVPALLTYGLGGGFAKLGGGLA